MGRRALQKGLEQAGVHQEIHREPGRQVVRGELEAGHDQGLAVRIHRVHHQVEERNKQQAVVMIGYPGADVLSPDRTLLDLLNEASNDLGSRFFNRIREQMGLAYFVGAGNFTGLAPGSFVFFFREVLDGSADGGGAWL